MVPLSFWYRIIRALISSRDLGGPSDSWTFSFNREARKFASVDLPLLSIPSMTIKAIFSNKIRQLCSSNLKYIMRISRTQCPKSLHKRRGASVNIQSLWTKQPGQFFCISIRSPNGKWADNFFSKEEFGEVRDFVRSHTDSEIYFCPHGFSRRRRQKEFAVPPKMCWADLDEVDPRTLELKPTIALESSPGRHVGLWLTDKPIEESLNRRLTRSIDADKGGWDLTQVLRFPGTINHKPEYKKPRVVTLWDDGPIYTVRRLDRILPEEKIEDEDIGLDAFDIYERYGNTIPRKLRSELVSGRATEGKRSDMVWNLGNQLLELGLLPDEAHALIKASPWNKFAGRRDEDERIREGLEKGLRNHLNGHKVELKSQDNGSDDGYINLEGVEEEEIDWIWYQYLARGQLTILDGDPGIGKSYLALMIGGYVADGRPLPTPKSKNKKSIQGRVLYYDTENALRATTVPRLNDNKIMNRRNITVYSNRFTIDDEEAMDDVRRKLEEIKPDLVFFDTLNTYIGKADIHRSNEAHQALGQFAQIAQDFNCSVVVLRHLTKNSGGVKALYRGQGSIALAATARIIMGVGHVPGEDGETRGLAVIKTNISRFPPTRLFRIESNPKDEDRALFSWGEDINLSGEDLLDYDPKKDKEGGAGEVLEEIKQFLRDALQDGPIERAKIKRMAERRSYSVKGLRRAVLALGIEKKLVNSTWMWIL